MMLVLLNGMASGYLGVRPQLADRLVDALNADRRIDVHVWGSMGESDMSPVSDLALGLYGDVELAAGEAPSLELMLAAQAVDLRKAAPLGSTTGKLHKFVRRFVPYAARGDRAPHIDPLLAALDREAPKSSR